MRRWWRDVGWYRLEGQLLILGNLLVRLADTIGPERDLKVCMAIFERTIKETSFLGIGWMLMVWGNFGGGSSFGIVGGGGT